MALINSDAAEALLELARREVDDGLLPAAQLALARDGEVVLSESFGDATDDTVFHMYSAVKPSVALTVLELAAEGLLSIDAPVADVLGSFAANGKEAITVSQLMLHVGGFPYAPLSRRAGSDRSARLAEYAAWRTDWVPGSRFEYHPTTAHWVLADLITEVTGRHHADVITERVLEPAGCSRWLALSDDQLANAADVVSVGSEPTPEELRAVGISELPDLGVTHKHLERFNRPEIRAMGVPGAGGMACASDVALWYQAVLHNANGFLRPEVRREAVRVRLRLPDWTGVSVNRSRVFMMAGDDGRSRFRGHAAGASPEAFGHNGAKGQIAWADPGSGLSFVYFTNGLNRNDVSGVRRSMALSDRALACAS